MTGVIATIPRIQFTNALGVPLAGGKLYTYEAGTTKLAATYQDQDLKTRNENPIPLDATGSALIWLDPAKSYKFVLKNKLGIVQPGWPVDNISGASNLVSLEPTLSLYAKLTDLAAAIGTTIGASLIGFVQAGINAARRTLLDKARERVSIDDFFLASEVDATLMVQRALNSGALRIVGNGKTYTISSVTVPAGVDFDGEGGQLLTNDGTRTKIVVQVGGDGATIQNWRIASDTPGVRKGFYGVNVDKKNTTLRNLSFQDITYSAVFNDADGTHGIGITAQNCGWDAVSNYLNAKNSTFRDVKGVANGRSLMSTDPGATGIYLDGFEAIDNGLDEIVGEHKDVLHFEYAKDCVFKNGVIRYTSTYNQGKTADTWAIMRWNASTNCVIQNVDIKIESSANGKLILGLVDVTGSDGSTRCAAIDINVDATAISAHLLKFLSYDGASRFKLLGGNWRGNLRIESGVAAGNAFQSIKRLEMDGPGVGTAFYSQYITNGWDISEIKLRGYSAAFNLNGFRDSSIANCDLDGVTFAFELTNTNAASAYQPNGGAITNNIIRMQTGTVIRTNNQQARPLIFAHNILDGSATTGLDTSGGTANATTAAVKAIANLVGGALTTVQSGTNSAGVLNANMNNLTQ